MNIVLPLWHITDTPPTGPLYTHWYVEPTIALGVFVVAAAYIYLTGAANAKRPDAAERPITRRQRVSFLSGLAILFIALGPPLDDWSDWFLLSAHMVQHLILMLVVPPLLLIGTPDWLLRPLVTKFRVVERAGYYLTRPLVSFMIVAAVTIVWHFPQPYDAALRSDLVHSMEHSIFIGASLLAWWSINGNLKEWPRLSEPLQALFLFVQMLPMVIVGAFITLADSLIYTPYGEQTERPFGIDVMQDQQYGGLIMWVASTTYIFIVASFIFFRWANNQDRADHAQPVVPSSMGGRRG
jgi:putative membrane protein